MSYAAYLRSRFPDYLLCALMALGLGLNVVQGFHIPDVTAESIPLVCLATALPLAPLFLVGYDKRSFAIGIPAIAVSLAAYGFGLSQITATPLFAETYENAALVFVVLLPVVGTVFALTRTRVGIIVCFAAGCITCAAIQFLYSKNLVGPSLLFMISCASLFLFKSSRKPLNAENRSARGPDVDNGHELLANPKSDRKSNSFDPKSARLSLEQTATLRNTSIGPVVSLRHHLPLLAMSVSLTSLAALLATGVFFLVIAPLNPPAHELKLITEYYSLEEVHVSGVLAFLHQQNEDLSSSNEDDRTRNASETDDETQDAEGTSNPQADEDDPQLGEGSYDALTVGDPLSIVQYLQEHWWVGAIALFVLALAWILLVVTRRIARKKRMHRWKSLGARGEYIAAFDHLCTTLERAKLLERSSKTPLELANSANELATSLERKDSARAREEKTSEGSEFSHIAKSFARINYGQTDPTPTELAAVESYVGLLPKRLARRVGHIKYARYFFRA